jgi:signal transduction histidine kinase/class 3 adenylate cyclase
VIPRADADDVARLRREIEYYRRRADELGGEILRLDYAVSGLRHEVRQKRQAFAVLSGLQQSVAPNTETSAMFALAIQAINATLGMDKTLVLTPAGLDDHYRPGQWLGFPDDAAPRLSSLTFRFPAEFARGEAVLIANKATPATPLIEELRAKLELPYFVCIPVTGREGPLGVLLSGRLKEARPLYSPFNQGDVDTLQAIARFVSSYVGTLRIRILEESDRLKNTFFANLSHELRTPIALTLGPLEQVIAGRYGELPESVRRQMHMMLRNQERLLGLVNGILELAKLEAGGMKLRAAPIADVNRFVAECAACFKGFADKRGLQLRLSLDPAVRGTDLLIDRELFSRVLVNLLSNAFKFTRKGHVEIATEIDGDAFRLSVSDTGIGIRPHELAYVFDRFRQADGSDSREFAGTGIGLALVKEIATLHGGEARALSEYGKGSVFQVSIPLGRAHLDPASVVEAPEEDRATVGTVHELLTLPEVAAEADTEQTGIADPVQTFDPARPTVLYAEDSEDLRHHVCDLLAPAYNVVLAVDGRDGLEKARQHLPDLILADQMMPHVSGRDLLRAIRGDQALCATPVIFLTARAGTEARIETLEAGADDYLAKPFHGAELLARVRNVLQARAQERELARLNHELEGLNRDLTQRVQEQVGQLERLGKLKRFFSPQLAESIVAGDMDDPLRTHRRELVVVFGDLRGFTAFAEASEPEVVMNVLREFHAAIGALIVAYEGTLERFTGDGMMVLFNDPLPVANAAERGVRMAVAIRDRVSQLVGKWRRLGYDLDLGMGIAQGYATIGAIGFEGRWDYGAIGTVTNLAARLCAEAKPGQILVSQRIFGGVEAIVKAEPVGPLTLKGFRRPVPAYDVRSMTVNSEP